jgi:hypothetical protein
MRRARQIKDRAQQRDFPRACVEQITVAGDEVNLQFSLNLPAAIGAIEKSPEGNDGPGPSGRNCQQRQRPKVHGAAQQAPMVMALIEAGFVTT